MTRNKYKKAPRHSKKQAHEIMDLKKRLNTRFFFISRRCRKTIPDNHLHEQFFLS